MLHTRVDGTSCTRGASDSSLMPEGFLVARDCYRQWGRGTPSTDYAELTAGALGGCRREEIVVAGPAKGPVQEQLTGRMNQP